MSQCLSQSLNPENRHFLQRKRSRNKSGEERRFSKLFTFYETSDHLGHKELFKLN